MILTKEFLGGANSCVEGYRFGLENNLIGNDYDAAIKFCAENGHQDFADWLTEQKSTEKYVRANGSIFTMKAYQVFNPYTGQYTKYETEAEAKVALAEVVKQMVANQVSLVNQELVNENGDATWVPVDLIKDITVS